MTDFCVADDADGPGPNRPTARGRMGKRPGAEKADGPEIKTDITGPIESTARGPRHLTALGRTGPIEPTAPGRTARRPRAVEVIGPVSILNIEMDRAGLHLALGYLPGVLPFGTWRYDPERHALYGGQYFATYEEAGAAFARRRSGRA
jgi:hypothetical protein